MRRVGRPSQPGAFLGSRVCRACRTSSSETSSCVRIWLGSVTGSVLTTGESPADADSEDCLTKNELSSSAFFVIIFYDAARLLTFKQAGNSGIFAFEEHTKKLVKAWKIEGMVCSSFWNWVIGSGALVVVRTKGKDKVRLCFPHHWRHFVALFFELTPGMGRRAFLIVTKKTVLFTNLLLECWVHPGTTAWRALDGTSRDVLLRDFQETCLPGLPCDCYVFSVKYVCPVPWVNLVSQIVCVCLWPATDLSAVGRVTSMRSLNVSDNGYMIWFPKRFSAPIVHWGYVCWY